MTLAPLALTMGEPAGIGGEVTIKAWLNRRETNVPKFFAIDDPARLDRLAKNLEWPLKIAAIENPADAINHFDQALPVLAKPLPGSLTPGDADPRNATAVIGAIDDAVNFVQTGAASAMVTNPINKHALMTQGFQHAGHTDYLAERAGGTDTPVMMLACPGLRVVPLTVHMPLQDAIAALSTALIVEKTMIVNGALMRDFGIESPHIAISGLNPHAGEGGMLGSEETEIIQPAVEMLKRDGLSVRGPIPADTMFHDRARAGYDAAICMYHDQALIPIKTLDFYRGVNITLGLPFIRTSPDHGTAFEIAGAGVADERSLVAALKTAAEMARRRQIPETTV
jgi:4-hydroxythreonine-4-phosphate dehydrogenase